MPEIVGRLRTPRLSTPPSSPVVGEVYYDTVANKLLYWDGTAWGTDIKYGGSHVPASAYKDGDIVVSGGVAYLCVRPTTAAPTAWPTVTPWPDTTGKLANVLTVTTPGSAPTWQAPAPQGADLVYNGAFPANTPYTDGDIVMQNGVAYMCVRPTSAAPTPWQTAPIVGRLINVQTIAGATTAYRAVGSGDLVTTTAAGSPTLSLAYTPAVPVYWDLAYNVGLVAKTDAFYNYGIFQLELVPADANGISIAGQEYFMQHSQVQTYMAYKGNYVYSLIPGTAYTCYVRFTCSAGTWQYNQTASVLHLQGKVFTR
jgi:hypothetical protein